MSLRSRFSAWERQSNRTKIFLTLLNKSMTFSELLEETGFSRSTLSNHLKAMQKSEVIERAIQNERIVYQTVLEPNKLHSELGSINIGILHKILEAFDSDSAKMFESMLKMLIGKIIEVKVERVEASLGISPVELYKHMLEKEK